MPDPSPPHRQAEDVLIGLIGRDGRMGRAVAEVAGPALCGAVGRGEDPAALLPGAQVLIDFSVPDALPATLAAARQARVPVLIGTTGLTDTHEAMIDAAAADIALIRTGNTSLGVTLLAALVEQAAARLGDGWDIEIVETHHGAKRDAPSGTALLLGEAAAAGRGASLTDVRRDDPAGARPVGSIGFAALRGGTVAGDHDVLFLGPGEQLRLSHRAESRRVFAEGAVAAARWLVGRAPGRYAMRDVLDLP